MADLTLSDGREIDIDLTHFTVGEYRALFDKTSDQDDATLAKACGIPESEIEKLNMLDYKRLFRALVQKASNPLTDPN